MNTRPVLALVPFLSSLCAWSAPGDLDPSFGAAGIVAPPSLTSPHANAILQQGDGKIVVLGTTGAVYSQFHPTLVRYTAGGALDTSFGSGGILTLAGGTAYGLAQQADGRLLVGYTTNDSSDFQPFKIARLLDDGSLDPTFGTSGLAQVGSGSAGGPVALALDAADRSLMLWVGGNLSRNTSVYRFTTNGSYDTVGGLPPVTHTGSGTYPSDGYNATSLVSMTDGRVLIGGVYEFTNTTTMVVSKYNFVYRLNSDLTTDNTFGSSGAALLSLASPGARSLQLQPDGSIVFAGQPLARFTSAGALDTSFGSSGQVQWGGTGPCCFLLAQPDDKIVAVDGAGGVRRFNASGASDTLFGTAGVAAPGLSSAVAAARQLNGRILVVADDYHVARYLAAAISPRDLDADGNSDLLWSNSADGSVQAWLMNGLTATNIAGLLPTGGGYTVTQVADLNGDGFDDLLIRNTDGTVIAWLMNGLNVIGQNTLAPAGSGYTILKVGDLNGDGKADILWQAPDGSVQAWLMDGLNPTSIATFVGAGSGWTPSQVADFDGDGKDDIVWQNTDGSVQLWLMNGLSVTGIASLAPAGSGWSVVLTGDFNGDGKADLMWQHTNGATQTWLMNGLTVTGLASFTPAASGWTPVLAGDIDGDGKDDLFWQHTSGASQTWLMNGLNVTSLASFVSAGNWSATHLLDLNGDGKRDIFWRNTDGSVQAWLMNGLTVTGIASLALPGTYLMIPPMP